MTKNDDIFSVTTAPAEGMRLGTPQFGNMTDRTKYLWLVTPSDVLAGLEHGDSGLSTSRRYLAHTNLSGGKETHAGGELWFPGHSSIWMTGGSGRYPPRSPEELDAVKQSFIDAGYDVRCAGWDYEVGRPSRVFREGPT